jgi:putative membrane protein
VLHVGFLVLEMFLWTKPLGLKIFQKGTPENEKAAKARDSAVLAANQGLYNGFLAAGLFWGLMAAPADFAFRIKVFFLLCVIVAGVFGAATVNPKIVYGAIAVNPVILILQAGLAALALFLLWFA